MKRLFVIILACASGCSNPPEGNPNGDASVTMPDDLGTTGPPYVGGSIQVQGCGYMLTSRDEANPPTLGVNQLGADPTPWGIHLGFVGAPSTSMVIQWRTNDDTTLATTAQFGENGKLDGTATGYTFDYSTANYPTTGQFQPVRVHQAHLCGLKPDTSYSYRVGGTDGKGGEKWSDTFVFHTAPDPANGAAQATVVFVGDTRDLPAEWGKVLKQADSTATPDVIFFSGDAVSLGPIQTDWDAWWKAAPEVFTRVPVVFSQGNHEVNAVNYFSQFASPGNQEYFSLDYGPVHLTVLNDTPSVAGSIAGAQVDFLTSDLTAAATRPWRMVMHHKPPYSIDLVHGGEADVLAAWVPVYDQFAVDVVLNGHVHGYQRSNPLRAGKPQVPPATGTVYVVSGGGGAPLYTFAASDPKQQILKTAGAFNFTVLKVQKGALQVDVWADDGMTSLDSFMLTK